MGDLTQAESAAGAFQLPFLREVEATRMTRSFNMVLLDAVQELGGWLKAPMLPALAERSWQVLQRRRPLLAELPAEMAVLADGTDPAWQRYWLGNPVNAWIGGNLVETTSGFFRVEDQRLATNFSLPADQLEPFSALVQELVDYRLAACETRRPQEQAPDNVIHLRRPASNAAPSRTELPFFRNLRVPCGHFRTGNADAPEFRSLGSGHGRLDPARHFIARASGNSMDGGKDAIRDGDDLLLEHLGAGSAGSISGCVLAIERQDEAGDDQYLLHVVSKTADGATSSRPTTLTIAICRPAMKCGRSPDSRQLSTHWRWPLAKPGCARKFRRYLARRSSRQLEQRACRSQGTEGSHPVTLNRQGKAEDHRYLDHWLDEHSFHWHSQNSSSPTSKRGCEIIDHQRLGMSIHLFVRDARMAGGTAARFVYHGPVTYRSHSGSEPRSVIFEVM